MTQAWPKSTKDAAGWLGVQKQTLKKRLSRAGELPLTIERGVGGPIYMWSYEQIQSVCSEEELEEAQFAEAWEAAQFAAEWEA